MGSCVYHVAHQSMRQSLRQVGQNVELANYTQALYDARELAMERMQAEALEAKAEGIVGVDLHERSHGWGSHVIEFFAIGTAIIPAEGAEDHVIPRSAAGARPVVTAGRAAAARGARRRPCSRAPPAAGAATPPRDRSSRRR